MTEQREYRVVCDRHHEWPTASREQAVAEARVYDADSDCGPHRVESRVVGEWGVEG